MAYLDIKTLRQRYIESCNTHGVLPNDSILCVLNKAEEDLCRRKLCSIEIFLDHLKDADFLPLLDLCSMIDRSEIDTVDVCNGSPSGLKGENALALMRAVNQKLRVVDLNDSFGKDFSRDLCQNGLPSQFLVLMASDIRKLNMSGKFAQILTLNLDFSSSLRSFHEDCFASMPNLKRLSMCETRISNLWTTSAALSKLPSLIEVRFQNWLCCSGADSRVTSSCEKLNKRARLVEPNVGFYSRGLSFKSRELLDENSRAELVLRSVVSANEVIEDNEAQNMLDSSNYNETEFSNHLREYINDEFSAFSEFYQVWDEQDSMDIAQNQSDEESYRTEDIGLSYIPYHTSPICFERHYREYMIASLPRLKNLDNLSIRDTDKARACTTYLEIFEHLPYRRNNKESLVSILQKREIKARSTPARNSSFFSGNSQNSYTKSFSAAKMRSSPWPLLRPISISSDRVGEERQIFRPRQFEYHPCDPSMMVFGTLDGEIVVLNHESERIISYIHSLGAMNSVLGLCWLKKYPSKLIAGSDNGSLKLYDIRHVVPRTTGVHNAVNFDEFDQLTSVHVNSTDELFLASGYSRNVALYDICTGKRVEVFDNMHREHINVVKFANYSPSIFATSSFDHDVKMWDLRQKPIRPCYTSTSSRGNVMVCFSPDDHYLLVSGVDNEVRQLLAADGRLHLNYDIAPTRSCQNYTRSYYMNGRDYIISGSCDEQVVRVCCSQTGRRLRDVSLKGKASGTSMYVQSLRGDPFQDFSMSILAAYTRPSTRTEIVKVNMLASTDHEDEHRNRKPRPNNCMGG